MTGRDGPVAHRAAVCNAAANLFEQRHGVRLPVRWSPDERDRDHPAVDLQCQGLGTELVIEHTLVETTPDQIAHGRMCVELLGLLEIELKDKLPLPGHYVLTANPAECKGLNATQIRAAVAAWVRGLAPTLALGQPGSTGHHVEGIPPGAPLHLSLARWPRLDGMFFVYFVIPEELDEKRQEQVRSSLDKKCPKLLAARTAGVQSLLVLELNDISLGNDLETARAVVLELSAREGDVPDHVYLIDTVAGAWTALIAKERDCWFPAVDNPGPHMLTAENGP